MTVSRLAVHVQPRATRSEVVGEHGGALKIRLADSGKLLGAKCLNHPAFVQECREWLGPENVVVKTAFTGK